MQTEISSDAANNSDSSHLDVDENGNPAEDRKHSVVSISTTISQSISPQPTPIIEDEGHHDDAHEILERLGSTPYLRALLLLAEMSSAGNLLTGAYTEECVKIARENKDFVMGFIAQRSLNSEPGDNFLTMTPGVKIPPKDQEGKMGDGKGQQYTSPRQIVYEQGSDVVIVGRGIIQADNRAEEAERYRKEAWAAYEERIAKK